MAKRNFIKLIKNVEDVEKGKEALYETFVSPSFVPFRKMYEALDILDAKDMGEAEGIETMVGFVCDVYGHQFTFDDVIDRTSSPDLIPELRAQIKFFAQGEMEDERKKELQAMLK